MSAGLMHRVGSLEPPKNLSDYIRTSAMRTVAIVWAPAAVRFFRTLGAGGVGEESIPRSDLRNRLFNCCV